MVGEVVKLVGDSDGTLDTKAAESTVAVLMGGGSDPVITKQPTGAWTSAVTDKMKTLP
jgi:NitT/TauT family transport system substrate-binding protein